MSMDFGKLNFAVGFNRTSAFPLDANSYFESYSAAQTAAAGAATVGSSDSAYYIGQLIIVNESGKFGLYQIGADKTLVKFGQASSAEDLKSQLDALAARVDGLDTSKAGWKDGQAPEASAGGSLVVFDASGKINASGIKVIDSAVNNSAMEVPTSKAVQTYVATQVAGAVQYLGTVSALTGLSTTAGKGDFYRLSAAIEGAHAGDLVVAEKDNPKQLINGTDWSLIHGEEVGVEAINAGSGINVSGSEAQPTIAVKPATTTAIGGIIVGTNLTIDGTGKLSAIDTTYEDATTTTHGLMSTADKVKLNGIEEGANKTIVDASLSATSANPVENKAVHAEFNSVRTLVSSTESSLQDNIDQVSANLSSAQTTLQANIDGKVDKIEGQGLSTNDFTTAEKNKLAGLSNYTLKAATSSALGGIKIGYSGTAERTYAVQLDTNSKAYVNVPWESDTNQKITAKSGSSTVTFGANDTVEIVAGSNVTVTPNTTNKTITIASKDTVYTHPAGNAASKASGFYKFSTDAKSHIDSVTAVTKEDITGLGIPGADTWRPIQVQSEDTDSAATINFVSGNNISLTLTHLTHEDGITINHAGPGDVSQSSASATPSDGGTVAFGGSFYVPTFAIDANGHTRDLGRTKYTLPTPEKYSLTVATTSTLGGVKSTVTGTEAGKDYYVEVNPVDGTMKVNVPWTDTKYTLPVASEGALGGIKVGYSGTTAKTYAVKLDANNKAYVEVPWQNTTYTNGNGLTLTGTAFSLNVASSAMHGGIKLYNDKLNKEITPQAASEVNGRYYRIQLDNANRAFVNVPWTDTNTFRTIQVNGTAIDSAAPLNLKNGTEITFALEHGSSESVTASIQQVSTDKLVQGTNTLIINGGGAAW